MTHIREQIISALVADGWTYKSHSGAFHFERMQETGGQFGRAKQTLVMDAAGRWLERVDGWGSVECTVDLRDHIDPGTAIAKVMER